MAGRVRQTARQLSDGASLSRGQHPCIGVPPNLKGSCADSRIVTAIGQQPSVATVGLPQSHRVQHGNATHIASPPAVAARDSQRIPHRAGVSVISPSYRLLPVFGARWLVLKQPAEPRFPPLGAAESETAKIVYHEDPRPSAGRC